VEAGHFIVRDSAHAQPDQAVAKEKLRSNTG
jgi:hypothetical protein